MTPDEQEALSRMHSNATLVLLPLRSGRWAIFDGRRRQLLHITDNHMPSFWLELTLRSEELARQLHLEYNQLHRQSQSQSAPSNLSSDKSAEEIGL